MSRHVLAYEGRPTVDRRRIDVGALWWENLPLPVLALRTERPPDPNVVARIVDIRRDVHPGLPSGPLAIVWADVEPDLPHDTVLAIDGDRSVAAHEGGDFAGVYVFKSLQIRAATICPAEAWAWTAPIPVPDGALGDLGAHLHPGPGQPASEAADIINRTGA